MVECGEEVLKIVENIDNFYEKYKMHKKRKRLCRSEKMCFKT